MGTAKFKLRTQMAIAGDHTDSRMTFRRLSELAQVSTSTLSRMANNEQRGISLKVLERICNVLGCTPNDLLWGKGPGDEVGADGQDHYQVTVPDARGISEQYPIV